MQTAEFERRLETNLHKYVSQADNPNAFLLQLIELAGAYLNMQTIADYARDHAMSYNGVKKCRNVRTIFNTKFVIDNE